MRIPILTTVVFGNTDFDLKYQIELRMLPGSQVVVLS